MFSSASFILGSMGRCPRGKLGPPRCKSRESFYSAVLSLKSLHPRSSLFSFLRDFCLEIKNKTAVLGGSGVKIKLFLHSSSVNHSICCLTFHFSASLDSNPLQDSEKTCSKFISVLLLFFIHLYTHIHCLYS